MLVVRHSGVALLLVTPLALLIGEAGSPGDPWRIGGSPVLDTAIGCAIALLVLLGYRLPARERAQPGVMVDRCAPRPSMPISTTSPSAR